MLILTKVLSGDSVETGDGSVIVPEEIGSLKCWVLASLPDQAAELDADELMQRYFAPAAQAIIQQLKHP